jgi:hypothetical protein
MQILESCRQLQHYGFSKLIFQIGKLMPGTQYSYQYVLSVTGTSKQLASGSFKTQELWQWRKDPPTFSFLSWQLYLYKQSRV